MKLSKLFITSALTIFAACSKNQDTSSDLLTSLTAINPQVKTTTSDGKNVMWENGDEIAVFVQGGSDESQSAVYRTNISSPAATATFTPSNGLQPVKQGNNYLAVYPASQLYVWNSAGKKKCSMDLPADQKVSVPGWDKRASLMAASSASNEFFFNHCVSYVKFTVTESSPEIVSFSVSSGNGTEAVASRVSVSMADDNAITVNETTPANLQKTEATLSMENGGAFPVGIYYVAILSKTYSEGLILICKDAEGNTFGRKNTPDGLAMTPGTVGNYGEIKSVVSGSDIEPLKPFDIFNGPKYVSLVGDSITTYEGTLVTTYADSENGGAYYPTGTVTSVTQQYWHKVIKKMSNAVLEVNNSLRGSMVIRRTESNYENKDYTARVALHGLGSPDVVFIHGGTNDCTKHSAEYAIRPGMYRADMYLSESFLTESFSKGFVDNPAYDNEAYKGMSPSNLPSDEEFNKVYAAAEAADTWEKVTSLEDRTFIHAYVKLLNMIHFKHPNAKVVMIIGDALTKRAQQAILKIAEHYGQLYGYKSVNFFGLADSISKVSGAHPDDAGFTYMADEIYRQVGSYIDGE